MPAAPIRLNVTVIGTAEDPGLEPFLLERAKETWGTGSASASPTAFQVTLAWVEHHDIEVILSHTGQILARRTIRTTDPALAKATLWLFIRSTIGRNRSAPPAPSPGASPAAAPSSTGHAHASVAAPARAAAATPASSTAPLPGASAAAPPGASAASSAPPAATATASPASSAAIPAPASLPPAAVPAPPPVPLEMRAAHWPATSPAPVRSPWAAGALLTAWLEASDMVAVGVALAASLRLGPGLRVGAQAGYATSRGSITVYHVPMTVTVGWESVAEAPVELGLATTCDWKLAESGGRRSDSVGLRLGPYAQVRMPLGAAGLGLLMRLGASIRLVRQRFLYDGGRITEAPWAASLATGMDWR